MHAIVHFTTSLSPPSFVTNNNSKEVMISQLVSVPVFSVRILDSSVRSLSSFMNINSFHETGTFMCPHNAFTLRDGHVYVLTDVVQSNKVNSEAKRGFVVNPCLLSSNKCRSHLSTNITRRGRQERAVLMHDCL